MRVPEGYLALAAQLRTWIAQGILREVWSSRPLDALPAEPPLPEELLARHSAGHWLECTTCGQLFSLEVTFERDAAWSPRDPDIVPSSHPAIMVLRGGRTAPPA